MVHEKYSVNVLLNVYDLHKCNGCLMCIGLGLFHCGIELRYEHKQRSRRSKEYSYLGHTLSDTTGVFHCEPKHVYGAKYRLSLDMGVVHISNNELELILDQMKATHLAKDYHILTNNCNHFCDAFVLELTGKHIPSWINRAASVALCCHCCIPQSFYDALREVQNHADYRSQQHQTLKSDDQLESPSRSISLRSSSVSSWVYQTSYLGKEAIRAKKKRKRQRLQSDSAEHIDGHDTTVMATNSEEKIDNYMDYGHSVSVVGLKVHEQLVPDINSLNENLVDKKYLNCSQNAPKLLLLKKREGENKNTQLQHLHEQNRGILCGGTCTSNSLSVGDNAQHDVEVNSNWSTDSYQQLPKIEGLNK